MKDNGRFRVFSETPGKNKKTETLSEKFYRVLDGFQHFMPRDYPYLDYALKQLKVKTVWELAFDNPAGAERDRLVRNWRADLGFFWSGPEIDVPLLLVEFDGGIWAKGQHVTGVGKKRDAEKQNAAILQGWSYLVFTTNDFTQNETWRMLDKINFMLMNRIRDLGLIEIPQAIFGAHYGRY